MPSKIGSFLPREIFLALGVLVVVVATVIWLRPETMRVSTAILAISISALGFLPAALFFRLPAEERPIFPLLVLTGAFYAFFFGLSAFAAEVLRSPSDGRIFIYGHTAIANISPATQTLALAGLTAMLAAYACVRGRALRLPRFRLPRDPDDRRSRLAFWVFLAAHLAFFVVPALSRIPSIGQFLQPAGALAFAGLYILWRRSRLGRLEAAVFFVSMGFEAALILRAMSLTPILLLIAMLLALEFALKQRVPWGRMLCCGLILMALYPAIQIVRPFVWSGHINGGFVGAPAMVARSLLGMKLPGRNNPRDVETTLIEMPHPFRGVGLARRVSHIALMEHVVAQTPERVPYWKGETYRPLLTSWIPRFIWPGKPREETGWTFGRRYGILKADDPPQSINLPWMIEMYANFGGPGVILGMGLVGALFAFLEAFLSRPSMTPAEMAAGTAVILPLFLQDSNFSLMTGSIPLLILAFWIVLGAAAKIPLPSVLSKDRPGP